MPTNKAAWLKAAHQLLQVDTSLYPTPGNGELVVKNAAVAINPVDWKIQETGIFIRDYPWIPGVDIAGEVVDVGPGVTRFKKGDRVMSYALSLIRSPSYGGFQLYTQADQLVTSHIPDDLPYENAVVLPLALSTAAAGLYEPQKLHLPYPTLHDPSAPRKPSTATIIVWGASSSVGSAVVQLGVASGLDIVGTSSARNASYVRDLGARAVVDYNSADVDKEVVAEVRKSGLPVVGAYDALGTGGWENVMKELGGGSIVSALGVKEDSVPSGVVASGLFAGDIVHRSQFVADAVWRDYVPKALQTGQLRAKPDPIVIEGGLDKVQEGLDRLKQGVSAAKVVVRL